MKKNKKLIKTYYIVGIVSDLKIYSYGCFLTLKTAKKWQEIWALKSHFPVIIFELNAVLNNVTILDFERYLNGD